MKIKVQVVFALPDRYLLRSVELALPATLAEAITASGIPDQCPEIDLERYKVGVFGRRSALDAVLEDGDRVEIYRPLTVDPKESRRRRAEHAKRTKPGKATPNG
ncbi:MAG: RnfH family protein [Burkholderiales bacterium]